MRWEAGTTLAAQNLSNFDEVVQMYMQRISERCPKWLERFSDVQPMAKSPEPLRNLPDVPTSTADEKLNLLNFIVSEVASYEKQNLGGIHSSTIGARIKKPENAIGWPSMESTNFWRYGSLKSFIESEFGEILEFRPDPPDSKTVLRMYIKGS